MKFSNTKVLLSNYSYHINLFIQIEGKFSRKVIAARKRNEQSHIRHNQKKIKKFQKYLLEKEGIDIEDIINEDEQVRNMILNPSQLQNNDVNLHVTFLK